MSDHTHAHGDREGHQDHYDGYNASTKDYLVGFVLSVILTAIPFWLVMGNVFENSNTTSFAILCFAAVQIVVHMIYFLHMNSKVEGGWSMLALVFTVLIVVIMLAGSIWVMYHLNNNMMPGMMHNAPHNQVPADVSYVGDGSQP